MLTTTANRNLKKKIFDLEQDQDLINSVHESDMQKIKQLNNDNELLNKCVSLESIYDIKEQSRKQEVESKALLNKWLDFINDKATPAPINDTEQFLNKK